MIKLKLCKPNSLRQKAKILGCFILFVYCISFLSMLKFSSLPNDEQIERTLNYLRSVYNSKPTYTKNIFCIILTKPSNFNKQAKIVNKTWAYDCDKYVFVAKLDDSLSVRQDNSLPIIQPSNYAKEDYFKLTDKVYGALKSIFLKYPDYNWYLKADDDTIIFMDHLRDFLKDKNPLDAYTFGCNFKEKVYRGYQSGGAGYVLSREALTRIGKKLNENYTFCPNSGAEDFDLARCMRLLDVFPGVSVDSELKERFHPFNIGFHINGHYLPTYYTFTEFPVKAGRASASETTISFHYMKPIEIYRLYVLWLEYRIKRKENHLFTPKFTSILYKILYLRTGNFFI